MQEEAEITCPFCWEVQTVLLDLSVPEQEYIEDCQVCCQPILIHYTSEAGELLSLNTERS